MLFEALLIGGAVLLGKKAIENPEKTKEIAGAMLGRFAEGVEDTKAYKEMYQSWDTSSLKTEFTNLSKESRTMDTAAQMAAIKSILESRGIYIEKR